VHRDFCEVAIAENDRIRSAGRIPTRVASIGALAQSLAADDVVAVEATAGTDKIVSVLQRHGVRVVVVGCGSAGPSGTLPAAAMSWAAAQRGGRFVGACRLTSTSDGRILGGLRGCSRFFARRPFGDGLQVVVARPRDRYPVNTFALVGGAAGQATPSYRSLSTTVSTAFRSRAAMLRNTARRRSQRVYEVPIRRARPPSLPARERSRARKVDHVLGGAGD
jgi:hypothetical protein